MYPQIHWELFTADPKGSTEHTLGTTALYEKVNKKIKKIKNKKKIYIYI